MLNLVELGLSYLPLLLIAPKMCSFFISGEIIMFRQKERLHERFQGRFEARGSPEHQEEQNRAKEGKARPCTPGKIRQPARHMARPPRAKKHGRATVHGQAVLLGMAVPPHAPVLRNFAILLGLFIQFSFTFGGPLSTFSQSIF